jgi:small-conductance mechanosensitive channel
VLWHYQAAGGELAAVSLWDLLLAVAVVVLMLVVVKNLSGLLEMTILQPLALQPGNRYAVTMISRYTILTFGLLIALNMLGIGWGDVQWLVAAMGVGLGFGLQSIASNFISGVIILLDRSVTLGDFIELEDGRSGRVTELSLRATTLETYDGKDIVVPNETFIASSFINWTHKDNKQRYRVDFSVAYHTDIRALVEVVKQVVGEHPQVITGENVPFEERPDCEIDSFGDSGINMFVEFWMEGIDDGKNRVGGDLLLIILEAIRDHGYEIPFPQREVRILNGPTKL